MFVDASALVAILTEEIDGEALSARLEAARHPFTSPLAVFEAALAIRRKRQRLLFKGDDFSHTDVATRE